MKEKSEKTVKSMLGKFSLGVSEGTCATSTAIVGTLSVAAGIVELKAGHIKSGVKLVCGGVVLDAAALGTAIAAGLSFAEIGVDQRFIK